MMNCIRCGAEVHVDGRFYATEDGGVTCPSAMQGEAAIHRVAAPAVQKRRLSSRGTNLQWGLAALALWELGRRSRENAFAREDASLQATLAQQPTSYVQQAAQYISGR